MKFRKKPEPAYVTVVFRNGVSRVMEAERSTYNGKSALILEDCDDAMMVTDADCNV